MRTRDTRVLVVDDEDRFVRLVQLNLEASGYHVITAGNGQKAIHLTASEQPDLILLDIALPGTDGITACKEIRAFSDVPIIMLTAFGQTENLVKGLDAGADDFISKPFSAQELLARIRAVLRRAGTSHEPEEAVYEADGLRVDFARRRVYVDGEEIHLTPTEYRLLAEMVQNAGRVLVPMHLLRTVWETEEYEPHLIWQAVHRLRQKIEAKPGHPRYIHTRPGIGYIFMVEERDSDA